MRGGRQAARAGTYNSDFEMVTHDCGAIVDVLYAYWSLIWEHIFDQLAVHYTTHSADESEQNEASCLIYRVSQVGPFYFSARGPTPSRQCTLTAELRLTIEPHFDKSH